MSPYFYRPFGWVKIMSYFDQNWLKRMKNVFLELKTWIHWSLKFHIVRTKLGWPSIRTIIYTFIRGLQIMNCIYENSGRTHHDFLSLNTKVNNAFGGRTAYLTAIVTTFTTTFAKFSTWQPRFLGRTTCTQ